MTAFDPDVLVTLDGRDGHRDQVRVRDVTVALAHELGVPVYLYCLSRRLMRRWAAVVAEVQPDSTHLALGELGTADEDIDIVLDTSEHLAAREAAIALHGSQVAPSRSCRRTCAGSSSPTITWPGRCPHPERTRAISVTRHAPRVC